MGDADVGFTRLYRPVPSTCAGSDNQMKVGDEAFLSQTVNVIYMQIGIYAARLSADHMHHYQLARTALVSV